jgi:hypothetical protein
MAQVWQRDYTESVVSQPVCHGRPCTGCTRVWLPRRARVGLLRPLLSMHSNPHTQLWVLSQPCRDFHNNH